MLPTPFLLASDQRQKRSLTQVVYLNNIIFQYTSPLSFETKLQSIHTIPSILITPIHTQNAPILFLLLSIQNIRKNTVTNSFANYLNQVHGIKR